MFIAESEVWNLTLCLFLLILTKFHHDRALFLASPRHLSCGCKNAVFVKYEDWESSPTAHDPCPDSCHGHEPLSLPSAVSTDSPQIFTTTSINPCRLLCRIYAESEQNEDMQRFAFTLRTRKLSSSITVGPRDSCCKSIGEQ